MANIHSIATSISDMDLSSALQIIIGVRERRRTSFRAKIKKAKQKKVVVTPLKKISVNQAKALLLELKGLE